MKICISSQGSNLDSPVDPRFGRCAWFVFVETDTMEAQAVDNAAARAGGGAGIQAGKTVIEGGAQALLTGNVGPNAWQTLEAGNVQVITGVSGTVREAAEKFKSGGFESTGGPTVDSHHGMK